MTDPASLRPDPDTLRRKGAVALKKGKDPLALAREFVVERLHEEEKREGLLDLPNDAPPSPPRVGHRSPDDQRATGLIEIYTDGGCEGNPGPGGWAALAYDGPTPEGISGFERRTTNNRMELRAAIEGLRHLKAASRVRLHSDSAYLLNPPKKGWLFGWKENGWKKADKKPVKNVDLWRELLEAVRPHEVEWVKVRGHSGVWANERCPSLVQLAICSKTPSD